MTLNVAVGRILMRTLLRVATTSVAASRRIILSIGLEER